MEGEGALRGYPVDYREHAGGRGPGRPGAFREDAALGGAGNRRGQGVVGDERYGVVKLCW